MDRVIQKYGDFLLNAWLFSRTGIAGRLHKAFSSCNMQISKYNFLSCRLCWTLSSFCSHQEPKCPLCVFELNYSAITVSLFGSNVAYISFTVTNTVIVFAPLIIKLINPYLYHRTWSARWNRSSVGCLRVWSWPWWLHLPYMMLLNCIRLSR